MIKEKFPNPFKKSSAGYGGQMIRNILAAFLIRGGAMIATLYAMPAYMRYFGDQKVLGVWFALLSILNWIITFDLGIGNGLRNKLVAALVANDDVSAKSYISSGYFWVGVLTLGVLALGAAIIPRIDWNVLLNIDADIIARTVLIKTIFAAFAGILARFFLKLITSIFYALQRPAVNHLLELISSVLTLLYISFSKSYGPEADLLSLAYAHAFLNNLPFFIATAVLFSTSLRKVRPDFRHIRMRFAKEILSVGSVFLLVQAMYMTVASTNEIMISHFCAPADVVDYQVYFKLFTLTGGLLTLVLTPVWSAVTRAQAEKNYMWIARLNALLGKGALAIAALNILMLPFLQTIVDLWLRDTRFTVNYIYAGLFALYGAVFVWHAYVCSIANGMGELKIQAVFLTLAAVLKIPAAYLGIRLSGSYVGVVVATVAVLLPFEIIQPIWTRRLIRRNL